MNCNSERIPRSLLERSGNPAPAGLQGALIIDVKDDRLTGSFSDNRFSIEALTRGCKLIGDVR